jgi:hypothetical protein
MWKNMWTIGQRLLALTIQLIIWRIFENKILELLKVSTNW